MNIVVVGAPDGIGIGVGVGALDGAGVADPLGDGLGDVLPLADGDGDGDGDDEGDGDGDGDAVALEYVKHPEHEPLCPPGFVTVTVTAPALCAVVVPVIVAAVIVPTLSAEPPKETVAPVWKLVPCTVTDVPPAIDPLFGVTDETVGAGVAVGVGVGVGIGVPEGGGDDELNSSSAAPYPVNAIVCVDDAGIVTSAGPVARVASVVASSIRIVTD